MGLISDAKALRAMSKLRAGGSANLSISQITGMIINLPSAKQNLSAKQFQSVYALFKELHTCTTPMKLDLDGYYQMAVKIILKFDAFAPYEKYSGMSETETSFLMDELRKLSPSRPSPSNPILPEFIPDEEEKKYIECLVRDHPRNITPEIATRFLKVLFYYDVCGRDVALKEFDNLVQYVLREFPSDAMFRVPFIVGMLSPNDCFSQEDRDAIQKYYSDMLMKREMEMLEAERKKREAQKSC